MNSSRLSIGVAVAVLVLFIVFELLRRRQLREKYAALWIFVGFVSLFFAIWPGVFASLSRLLGFGLPVNMAFAGAAIVLLLISMQLSLESGRREDETQRLAEEVALLRLEIERLRDERDEAAGPGPR